MKRASMAALAVGVAAGTVMAQPVQWRVEDGGNGHWYERVEPATGLSWRNADRSAMERGGYLVTVTSAAEQAFVTRIIPTAACCGAYIGLYQDMTSPLYSEPAGGWKWVTGEPITYTNWAFLEPENNSIFWEPREEFALADSQSRWRDVYGRSTDGTAVFIVEYSADCNNDGIVDKGQILSGQLPDANNNGIPDGVAILTQPADQNVAVDTPVAFVVEVAADAACPVPVTYQWQRRNPLVADPASPNAWIDLADENGLFGTHAPNLTLLRPIPALATGYRCKIGGGCGCEPGQGGFVYTNTVNFTVACPADFNADGGIDFGDIEAFFERWENGC